jgi:hypothetical protein
MGVLNGNGAPGANLPDGDDWISRRFSDIERFIRELTPSIARSIQPTVARLDATDVDLAAKQAALDTLITQVVKPQSVWATVSNFNLTAAHPIPSTITVIKTVTITVPAGFTAANISMISRVFAYNNSAGADFFFCQTGIAGVYDFALGVLIPAGGNGSGVAVSPFATTLTGLTPGSTFTITIGACSDYYSWTQTGNVATVSGNIQWYR